MKSKRFMVEYANYIRKEYGDETGKVNHIVLMYYKGMLSVNETMFELVKYAQNAEFDKRYLVKEGNE